jgi:HEPN domain-containing protein
MKPHEEWLAVAARDLESAKLLGSSNQNLLDIAIYHTQQSAEKAFKAYLSWKGQEIDRTHFLPGLVNSCISFDSEFKKLMDDSVDLNPYSTLYRYPDGDAGPSASETQDAIVKAERILTFVRSKVS